MNDPQALSLVSDTQVAGYCANALDGLGGMFLKAFHSTERDFLRLGRLLEDVNAKAAALASDAGQLASITSGDAVLQASNNLGACLGKIVSACEDDSGLADFSGLSTIAQSGVQLAGLLHDFSRLVKRLSMLGIATRIESARLGSSGLGFSTLADDVESLAAKIVVSSDKILARCNDLTTQTTLAGESVQAIAQVRKGCSMTIVDILRRDLNALSELTRSSRDTAGEVAVQADSICASVSEAVLSLQFHDIIRQQLEHVAEHSEEARSLALDSLAPPASDSAVPQKEEEVGAWLHSVLLLQRSQLGNARARFAEAMQNLEDSMMAVAQQVDGICARVAPLVSQQDGQGSVLAGIEKGVAGVAQSLSEYSDLGTSMAHTMEGVTASIQEMAASAFEIEEVGSEIELIAINASIKAAHTGEEGKALGVLALAIQGLSMEAAGLTGKVTELLEAIDSSSRSLQAASSAQASQTQMADILGDLDSEMAWIKELDTQVAGLATEVIERGKALSGEISASVSSMEFQHGLLDSMTQAETRLQEIVENLTASLPPGKSHLESPRLRAMLDRYTMDAERLVHESVLGIAPTRGPAKTQSVKAAPDDGFGDNVELF